MKQELTELVWGHKRPRQKAEKKLGAVPVKSTVDLGAAAFLQSDLCSVKNLSQFCFVFLTLSSMS